MLQSTLLTRLGNGAGATEHALPLSALQTNLLVSGSTKKPIVPVCTHVCVRMCVYVDMHVCVLCMYVMHVCMACMYACYAYMCVCMSVMRVMHEAFVTHVMYGMHDPNFVA